MKNKIKMHHQALHDMTQKELAKLLGATRSAINAAVRGKYNPSIKVVLRISKLFNVPVEEMFIIYEES